MRKTYRYGISIAILVVGKQFVGEYTPPRAKKGEYCKYANIPHATYILFKY